jgi:hypothetical protein
VTDNVQPEDSEPRAKRIDAGRDEQALLDTDVYRDQIELCAEAGPTLLAEAPSAELALYQWVALFVELLVTKPDLAGALRGDGAGSDPRYEPRKLVHALVSGILGGAH